MKDRTKRSVKDKMMGVLVLIAVIAAFFVAVGVLALLKHESCDRLDEERVLHLQPGHDTPGPRASTSSALVPTSLRPRSTTRP